MYSDPFFDMYFPISKYELHPDNAINTIKIGQMPSFLKNTIIDLYIKNKYYLKTLLLTLLESHHKNINDFISEETAERLELNSIDVCTPRIMYLFLNNFRKYQLSRLTELSKQFSMRLKSSEGSIGEFYTFKYYEMDDVVVAVDIPTISCELDSNYLYELIIKSIISNIFDILDD